MAELAPVWIVTAPAGVIPLWSLELFNLWLLVLTWQFPCTLRLFCSQSDWVCTITSHHSIYLPTSAKHLYFFPAGKRVWVEFANLNKQLHVSVYLSHSLMCNDMILFWQMNVVSVDLQWHCSILTLCCQLGTFILTLLYFILISYSWFDIAVPPP